MVTVTMMVMVMDDGESGNVLSKSALVGVWFWACKCPYEGIGGLFTHRSFPEVEAGEAAMPATP